MGRDAMSVVDGDLKVYGMERPAHRRRLDHARITTGNTMAPCVVIGERATEVLRVEHAL